MRFHKLGQCIECLICKVELLIVKIQQTVWRELNRRIGDDRAIEVDRNVPRQLAGDAPIFIGMADFIEIKALRNRGMLDAVICIDSRLSKNLNKGRENGA